MNPRNIKAPLSPKEELTLRRVALGIVSVEELPSDTLAHLRGFGLLDDANNLTPAGRKRYDSLQRPRASAQPADSFFSALQRASRTRG